MKNFIKKFFPIFALMFLSCILFALVGCSNNNNLNDSNNSTDETNTQPATTTAVEITSFDGATINEDKIFMFVERNIDSVTLSDKVQVSQNCTWKLYSDKLGRYEIPTKVAASTSGELLDGDNQFYILVSSNTEEKTNFYELTIHRSYEVDINYWFNDEIFSNYKLFTGNKNSLIEFNVSGYSFNGWLTDNQETAKENIIWEEQNFYADTTPNTYQISFNANGGKETYSPQKVTFGEMFVFPIPTRDGYSFSCWNYNSQNLTDIYGNSYAKWNICEDCTITAVWTPKQIKVELNTNSNFGVPYGSGYFNCGSEVSISSSVYYGYEFAGWYKNNIKVSDSNEYTFIVEPQNNVYTAHYEIAEEMKNFEFVSGPNWCKITGTKFSFIEELTIPTCVTRICEGSFKDTQINKLIMPIFPSTRYLYIEKLAFWGCVLKEAHFLEDVNWMLRAQTDNRPYGDYFTKNPSKTTVTKNAEDLTKNLSFYSWEIWRRY